MSDGHRNGVVITTRPMTPEEQARFPLVRTSEWPLAYGMVFLAGVAIGAMLLLVFLGA